VSEGAHGGGGCILCSMREDKSAELSGGRLNLWELVLSKSDFGRSSCAPI
jgi:hypothetical protein